MCLTMGGHNLGEVLVAAFDDAKVIIALMETEAPIIEGTV